MKKLFFLLSFFPIFVQGQINETFSDGNFHINPAGSEWVGDTSEYKINTTISTIPTKPLLQLNNTITAISYLATTNTLINNTEWHFYSRVPSTSATNYARFYLASDQQNLEGSLNGYFVQIGGADDKISLCKQTGATGSFSVLVPGPVECLSSINQIHVKVTRDLAGNWSLFSDTTNTVTGNSYILHGTFSEPIVTLVPSFAGVYCNYTSSNGTSYYFDDIYAGGIIVDTIAPVISSISAISNNQVEVLFSESVFQSIAETISNYSVNGGIGNPITAIRDATNLALVHLTFASGFIEGQTYSLTTSNIQDLAVNTMVTANNDFVFYLPKSYDIVINELMADPDPAVGLPAYEYMELYNRTNFPISLKDWTLAFGSYTKIFPDVSIQAHGYLILTKAEAITGLSVYGTCVDFFTNIYSLTNDGATIVLSNNLGKIIHTITYSSDWYQNANKKDGGWSLEQIDPNNPCGAMNNWRASVDVKGGTPGSTNSINAANADNIRPEIDRVGMLTQSSIQLFFTETLDSLLLKNVSNYSVDNSIGNPSSVSIVGPDFKSVILQFAGTFQNSVIYYITISDTIKDCAGNIATFSSAKFAIPSAAVKGDILINEVLSNPKDNGVDFVEIYNHSNKVIEMKYLVLASYDTINNVLTSVNPISADGFLIFPQEYYVLTTNPDMVKSQYSTTNPKGFVKMSSLPSFNNDDGVVVIANQSEVIIDKFTYSLGMQFPLLSTTDGVSLERLSFERPTDDKSNWHSAAENVGFATPAYKNSQYTPDQIPTNELTLSPEIFSPDNDGVNDVLNINYLFSEPGYVATIMVYDSKGRLVRVLEKSQLLGTSGTFSWDGINEDAEKSPIGIYIVYMEVFDLKGNTKHYKKTAVLASKL
ncbi:MAG: lamin tail domain-containing protein [Bacteroidetes bacterium]|nr:lamin tail domain-containing protein [Bacteroidota bacterium]